ncbi:biotin--[acetyl-CoA-carboxylase] ligase [Neoroseomonas oryzicola]|uniref:Biotin--[acetyl-CoA-carboxylase] ligase n=1 Tax=Neoroseomonas oryzicola TaxID=535904 RepID=A0A9X9WHQ9_9PROT|nr:biotin--[acetyl-CoA-carboxylase] ligase [Neoroseomonas oryzicola]NKE15691.1 biotin--[acetyl-CoA-carboxylase] ligase [Neoroseomonas oryzicola]
MTAAHRFRLRVHEALPSTSDLVARLADAGEPDGLAVLARRQTAGRGTQGRSWEGPSGNLHITMLLRPAEPMRHAPQWSLLAAVALADAVAPLLPDPTILSLKWPNDLLLGGAKAAGILTEASATSEGGIAWLSIGIGVNLAHAPEVPGRRTACLAETGIAPPVPEVFAEALLSAIDRRRTERALEGFGPVLAAWLARGPALDTHLAIRRQGAEIAGRFAGLAEDGSLLLASGGRVHAVASGEVA